MSKGFYKEIDGQWIYAPNRIAAPNYTLVAADKDSYKLPIDGWDWYEESPEKPSEFELWEARLATITSLKEQGQDSALALPISEFYEDSQEAISEFIKNGSRDFLTISENSELYWMDLRTSPENPSPREVLVSTLTPLVIE